MVRLPDIHIFRIKRCSSLFEERVFFHLRTEKSVIYLFNDRDGLHRQILPGPGQFQHSGAGIGRVGASQDQRRDSSVRKTWDAIMTSSFECRTSMTWVTHFSFPDSQSVVSCQIKNPVLLLDSFSENGQFPLLLSIQFDLHDFRDQPKVVFCHFEMSPPKGIAPMHGIANEREFSDQRKDGSGCAVHVFDIAEKGGKVGGYRGSVDVFPYDFSDGCEHRRGCPSVISVFGE